MYIAMLSHSSIPYMQDDCNRNNLTSTGVGTISNTEQEASIYKAELSGHVMYHGDKTTLTDRSLVTRKL